MPLNLNDLETAERPSGKEREKGRYKSKGINERLLDKERNRET